MVASSEVAGTRQGVVITLIDVQFLSRPFVVGDRVELSSGGGERVMVGVIERVDPIRTIIRTDASLPVTIPNKVLACHAQSTAVVPLHSRPFTTPHIVVHGTSVIPSWSLLGPEDLMYQ